MKRANNGWKYNLNKENNQKKVNKTKLKQKQSDCKQLKISVLNK